MTALRLVVFDVDGTLIDSQAHIVAALADMYAAGGRPPAGRDRLLSIVGLSLKQAIQRLESDLSDDEVDRWAQAYRDSFIRIRASEAPSPLYPGAKDALDRLSRNDHLLMGVATGKARRGLDHVIAEHDLSSYFVTLQTSDLHPSKPHPAMLEAAIADAGVEAAQTVMVGDTTFDIDMGRSAGARTIGVTWGYHAVDRLAGAGAERIIAGFDDLDDAVSELIGDFE